jgi:hypothetical protein
MTMGRSRLPLEGNGRRGTGWHDDVGLQADQLLRERSYPIDVTATPTKVHPHIAAINPTQIRKCLRERGEAALIHWVVSLPPMSMPMGRILSGCCCACATTGHAAALPNTAMNCRRFIE